jgi:hypothetical protein
MKFLKYDGIGVSWLNRCERCSSPTMHNYGTIDWAEFRPTSMATLRPVGQQAIRAAPDGQPDRRASVSWRWLSPAVT